MARRVLAVATGMRVRTEGLDGLKLPTDLTAQAGALAASHINALLATADTEAALATTQSRIATA